MQKNKRYVISAPQGWQAVYFKTIRTKDGSEVTRCAAVPIIGWGLRYDGDDIEVRPIALPELSFKESAALSLGFDPYDLVGILRPGETFNEAEWVSAAKSEDEELRRHRKRAFGEEPGGGSMSFNPLV